MKKIVTVGLSMAFCVFSLIRCTPAVEEVKPRLIISSDIGGTDPDDNQSMIHLLMYADLFQIDGLVSSPYGEGRKSNFIESQLGVIYKYIFVYMYELGFFHNRYPSASG